MNPFSSRAIRPDRNVYRFHPDPTTDQDLRRSFTAHLIETLRTHRLASVIGPHGTGKTTLLRSVEPALRENFCDVSWKTLSKERRARWHEVLNGQQQATWTTCPGSRHASGSGPIANETVARRLTPVGSCDEQTGFQPTLTCLVIDGFEQLSWWDRILLIRHVRRNASTALITSSHRPLRPIPVCHQTRWNAEMTRLLTAEKLAEIDEPARSKMWSRMENCSAFRKKDAANVRELWFALYDEFEQIRQQEQLKS